MKIQSGGGDDVKVPQFNIVNDGVFIYSKRIANVFTKAKQGIERSHKAFNSLIFNNKK